MPLKARIVWREDHIDQVENMIERKLGDGLEDVADYMVADVRENWSAESPSSPGQPPAMVTGNLDSSVKKQKQGRDLLGRFAGKNAIVYFVEVDASKGDNPMGRGDYAPILEDSMNRPFFEASAQRVAKVFGALITRKF